MSAEANVTPAMKAWCRRLINPDMCSLIKTKKHSLGAQSTGFSAGNSPTYVMVEKLEDAGLIEWVERTGDTLFRYVAKLTDAGRKAAGNT